MYFKSYDNLPIFYEIFEPLQKNEKTLELVFLHGLGGDSNALVSLAKDIQKQLPHAKCILYDLRGHGLSTKNYPQNKDSFEKVHSQDLKILLEHLKIQKPVLLGHCLGGLIVQEYLAENYSPKPEKIITICSTLKFPNIFLFRRFWYQLLKKLPHSMGRIRKRSINQHLSFKNSHDLSPSRVRTDIKNLGGFWRWLLTYGSSFGWKIQKIKQVDSSDFIFIFGKKDVVLPRFLHKKHYKKLEKAKKIFINSNHISPLSNCKKLSKTIVENIG